LERRRKWESVEVSGLLDIPAAAVGFLIMENAGKQALQLIVRHRLGLRRGIILLGIAYYVYEQK